MCRYFSICFSVTRKTPAPEDATYARDPSDERISVLLHRATTEVITKVHTMQYLGPPNNYSTQNTPAWSGTKKPPYETPACFRQALTAHPHGVSFIGDNSPLLSKGTESPALPLLLLLRPPVDREAGSWCRRRLRTSPAALLTISIWCPLALGRSEDPAAPLKLRTLLDCENTCKAVNRGWRRAIVTLEVAFGQGHPRCLRCAVLD